MRHAGRQVARLISGEPLTDFRYRDKGVVAVLGRGDAVAELPLITGAPGRYQLRIRGRLALDKAAYYHLRNLTAIVDVNRPGQRGPTELGWGPDVYAKRGGVRLPPIVIDGHDLARSIRRWPAQWPSWALRNQQS